MDGIKRHYFSLLKEYLSFFPCVVILGPRQCGKTTLVKELGTGWKVFDLEKSSDYQVVVQDPDLFFRLNPKQVVIDEAQQSPNLFPALRVAIDQDRHQMGRFVVTGSSSPELLSSISESLAGRVGIIEMSPLMLSEIVPSNENNIFFDLLLDADSFLETVDSLTVRVDLQQVHDYWFRGGYPEPWIKNRQRYQELWFENYVKTYLERDISTLFPSLNKQRFRQFIQMLSGLSGSIINYSKVSRTLGVSQPTVREYFTIAHGTYVWRQIPAFEKDMTKRIVKHPKGYMRDSGLLHHLLRLKDIDHLLTHPNFGYSWETMVIEELIRGLNCRGIGFDYYYYRTSNGAEIDLIIEGKFGLIPIEIKYHQNGLLKQLKNIRNFIQDRECPFGIVINNDERIRFYDETLIGLPFSYLI